MRRLAVLVIVLAAISEAAVALPTSRQVIDLMKKSWEGVRDYKTDAVLTVKSQSINVTGMPMTVYYKQPGKLHIDAKQGFALIPRDMRIGNPMEELPKTSNITVLGMQKVDGRNAVVVKVTPKDQTEANGHSFKAWIDAQRGLILSMAGGDEQHARVKSTWSYVRVEGRYWLPSEIKAEITMPQMTPGDSSDPDNHHGSRFHRPRMGSGTMTIRFRNYRVNRGIPDSIFAQPRKR